MSTTTCIHQFRTRRHPAMGAVLLALALLLAPAPARAIEADKNTAAVFVYQRIGEDASPRNGISLDQFREHIAELKAGGYSVMPLSAIAGSLKPGARPLPPKAVAITFDGAHLPTLSAAIPLLDEARFPFTVFFSSDQADANSPDWMSWSHLRALKKNRRATLGLLPAAYAHMTEKDAALINRAVSRTRDMLKDVPEFFAWPYGEYSVPLKKMIAGYSFRAAFGQQSGVVYDGADPLALPRFSMTEDYADLDRFRLTASALPLPVTDVVPDDMTITQNPPVIGFTVAPAIKDLSRLSCFVSGIGKANITRLPGNRVEVRMNGELEDRRTRVNCTMPATAKAGEPQGWRWFGMLLVSPALAEDTPEDDTPQPPATGGTLYTE